MIIVKKKQLVTIDVFYYMPDYRSLVQEFIYQVEDVIPELYYTHKFLNHWHKNIKCPIKEVIIGIADNKFAHYRSLDEFLSIN